VSGRPLKYGVRLEPLTLRLLPRTVEALKAEAKRRNMSLTELVDRLCSRAGLYKENTDGAS
jgi:hypothetical protein